MISECTNNKVFDIDNVAVVPVHVAWEALVKTAREAIENRDLDDFRDVRVPFFINTPSQML